MNSINNNHTINLFEQSFKGPSVQLLDSIKRIQYNSSYWYSIFHRKEKQKLNQEMWQAVSSFFQLRYQIDDQQHFLRIWKEIGQKEWSIKFPLTADRFHAIDAAFKKLLVYYGPGIAKLPSSTKHINSSVQQIVNILLHGGSLSKELIRIPLLQAILVKHDPLFLKQFRDELQLELNHLADNPPKNAQEEILWRQFLGYIIAILPFSYPFEGEKMKIPLLEENGACRLVEYSINIIEFSPNNTSSPMSAIGFAPIIDTLAPPILSYLGTTFPAGNGFTTTIKADFTPKMAVGEEAYAQAKEKIAFWFKNKTNVHLVGVSLGGAMAFHTIRDHYKSLSRTDIYNPPGLYAHCWKGQSYNDGCPINIYRQPGDIVSKMGFWPEGSKVKIFNIIPHQNGIAEVMPRSHIQAFSGCQKVTFLQSDPATENKSFSRKALVLMHRYFGPYLFYYPTCFLSYGYRKVCAVQKYSKILFNIQKK
ncbi:MAG: hypothetical protein H0X29_10580 [Parachlamydiaceae bacterium]|nr:hypothetical protein [Parachlamydiaceae bacterium]